jgi:hypothetical protein
MRLLLIDVKRMCLVKAWANRRYAALSYVWGNIKMLQTRKENLTELQKKWALAHRHAEIPRVIKDAIVAVHGLRMRYLWVDTLCIVQDDEQNKYSQIAQMNIIYTHAWVTLVALHGRDANAALRGATTPLAKIQEVIYGLPIVPVPPALFPILKSSYYNSRVSIPLQSYTDNYLGYSCISRLNTAFRPTPYRIPITIFRQG